jgi:hypothetical protein
MNKIHIFVIVLVGFLLMPIKTFACGSNSEKNSCKKEVSSKKNTESCCKRDKNSENKSENGCAGKCGHSKCGCPAASNGFTLIYEINFKNNSFDFSTEKQKYTHLQTFISSGFYTLWLIPKIS